MNEQVQIPFKDGLYEVPLVCIIADRAQFRASFECEDGTTLFNETYCREVQNTTVQQAIEWLRSMDYEDIHPFMKKVEDFTEQSHKAQWKDGSIKNRLMVRSQ